MQFIKKLFSGLVLYIPASWPGSPEPEAKAPLERQMRQFFRRIAGCEGGCVETDRFVEIWNAVVVVCLFFLQADRKIDDR